MSNVSKIEHLQCIFFFAELLNDKKLKNIRTKNGISMHIIAQFGHELLLLLFIHLWILCGNERCRTRYLIYAGFTFYDFAATNHFF